MRHTSRIPHPAYNIPHTTSRLLRSAEENDQLREQLAAKDKQIEELTKQLDNVKVKSGIKVGLWTSENMQHMRAVFKGPDGGTYIVRTLPYTRSGLRRALPNRIR